MTGEELEEALGAYALKLSPDQMAEEEREASPLPDLRIPSNFDWREVPLGGKKWNYVSPIKNQTHCGSCGVFAAMASVEGTGCPVVFLR